MWPKKARRAALELSAALAGEPDTMRTLLLSDIRVVFGEKKSDRIKTLALEQTPINPYHIRRP